MKKSLKMVFLDTLNKKQSILIPEVKDSITPTEVLTLAETIVAANIFGDELVGFTKALEAELISKDVTTYAF
ncbi:MAG: DUF2922 domain-containing protein [Clostridium sp.]|uniref:DUF2922 domain-containing protein n=1 Tax=Clostridium sp. TaxID=1506 RepID=UPI002FC72F56